MRGEDALSEPIVEISPGAAFLHAVREHAGEAGVTAVQRARGGSTVSVPLKITDEDHWLARCIGLAAAKMVCKAMAVRDADGRAVGRLKVLVPYGPESLLGRARAELDRLLLSGVGVRAAALQVGFTERVGFRRRARLVEAGKLRGGL